MIKLLIIAYLALSCRAYDFDLNLVANARTSAAEACSQIDINSKCLGLTTNWLNIVDRHLTELNQVAAEVAWESSVSEPPASALTLNALQSKWKDAVCSAPIPNVPEIYTRHVYLLCHGISYTEKQSEILSYTMTEMKNIYTGTRICIPRYNNEPHEHAIFNYIRRKTNQGVRQLCLSGEPDLERIMSESRNEEVLKWSWIAWRQTFGPQMKYDYAKSVQIQNEASRKFGFADLGQVWRDELEIPNLIKLIDKLFDDVRDLYAQLHGVTRFFLERYYNRKTNDGFIEGHITGDMWAHNWETILDIILPIPKNANIDAKLKETNWTTIDLVKRSEDFYMSMGMPAMTDKFWKHSIFNQSQSKGECHGTAANMFRNDDFRMIYCAELSMDDFYVIVHEMGHIQYYMSYEKDMPMIFQDGVNSAFQESIGDAIMLGMMTPQHLQRLGLIEDDFLNPENTVRTKNGDFSFGDILLLRQALKKLPHIPFAYIIDKYRWEIFSGDITIEHYNTVFWKYVKEFQGIIPPDNMERDEKHFDAASKFHVPDNTPYVRYFLSSFLQFQMYKGLCKWSVFNSIEERELPMPLYRCDVYGSKKAGRKLREMMSKGRSIHWSEALEMLTGQREITADAFLEYFAPLKSTLDKFIHKYNIRIGWNV